jgi:rod shape-determining protein MreC
MASPSTGRHSYARRAHYSAFAAYVIAVVGVVVGLVSATIWVVDPVGFANLRIVVGEVAAPVGRAINGTASTMAGADDSIAAWWRAGSQNVTLRTKVERLERENLRASGLEAENRQLRALLAISRGNVRPVATASILSSSAVSTRRFAVIDAGYGDGVRTGQPVRSADGLIGRTLEVGPSVARILLITDGRSIVPARRASDGLAVLITGRGDELLDVRTLNSATITLKVGDILLASGSGGLFQPRTPVARIVGLTRDGATARPIADPAAAAAIIVEPASAADLDEPPPPAESIGEAAEAQTGTTGPETAP